MDHSSKTGITTKQFQLLSDLNLVWNFMVEIYGRENGSGMPAPFFEHALQSSWMDVSYTYLDRLWFDGNRVVAFVYYESPVTDIYFNVRKGYEFLADELVDYAVSAMPDFRHQQRLVLFGGQEFLKEAAERRGFRMVHEYRDREFDFRNELNYELPAGYHFVEPENIDAFKLAKLCWYGFDHGEDGPFENWDRQDDSYEWTPAKSYKGVIGPFLAPSPHSTHEYDVVIADDKDEYVCFSGMWWVPENRLAYMEPLCTAPEYRRKGLAAAALTKHYRRMKALGAARMTGGADPFYEMIGYGEGTHWTFWKKDSDVSGENDPLIERFVSHSKNILKDNLVGIYLHGSAAMGCYRPDMSDLDLLVVVREQMPDPVKREYMDMLIGLDAEGPAKGIEMSVVTADVCDPFVYPTPFDLHYSRMHRGWYNSDPEDYIRRMNGTDKDLAAHFTVIRSRGRCLYGRPIADVFAAVPERYYAESIVNDISCAENEILDRPMYFILNLTRVLAYLEEKLILSKQEGGKWGLKALPEEYHPLLNSALREYGNGGDAEYDPELAVRYARYMLNRISGEAGRIREQAGRIERAKPGDANAVARLACELWPDHSPEEMAQDFESVLSDNVAAVFLYRQDGRAAGFAQCQLRHDYVEGTETSPVGYLEGIYVQEPLRRQGIARKLLDACEDWARDQGCAEFASDCELTNLESQRFHRAVGFEEANRIVAYVRKL